MPQVVMHGGFRYIVGSLTKATESVIAHGCNAQGKMGSGVAKAIKEKWPQVFLTYESEVAHGISLGDVVWARSIVDHTLFEQRPEEPWIANVITQHGYGRDGRRWASYDGIDTGLRSVAERAVNEFKVDQIAIPLIGCGTGMARWAVVREILMGIRQDYDINWAIYCDDESRLKETIDP